MLPLNTLSPLAVPSNLLFPDNILPKKQYQDWELGGIGLQQPEAGLRVQPWYGYWNPEDATVYLQPYSSLTGEPVAEPTPIFNQEEVFELSFTFDQNMRWTAATMAWGGGVVLRWFDSSVGTYVTTPFAGITAFKLCHDDKRTVVIESGDSDILFTYIKDNNLYFRAQRDRYTIEYLLYVGVPNNLRITHFGMADSNRVEWRMRYRKPSEMFPWL